MANKIEIVCVPPSMLGEMWPHIGPLLLRGQGEVTPNLKEALKALGMTLFDAQDGKKQIWAVCDTLTNKCIAAMVSEIVIEDGCKVVWVTSMGGGRILEWGRPMSDRMAAFAKAEGCECYRFTGRKALLRAYSNVKIVGDHETDGVHLFERAV